MARGLRGAVARAGATLALAAVLGGCGTWHSIGESRPGFYSGVRVDSRAVVGLDGKTGMTRVAAFIDLPFSLAMDTVLLPFTIPISLGMGDDGHGHGHGHGRGHSHRRRGNEPWHEREHDHASGADAGHAHEDGGADPGHKH